MPIEPTAQRASATAELEPIGRPRSIADEVYRSIRAAIVRQQLKPGERVTETALADTFNVSKTPVREALLRLHEVGLVSLSLPGHSARIVSETPDAVQNALEVRGILERATAALAAARRSAEDVKAMTSAAEASVAYSERGDADGFAAEDAKFHLSVAQAAQNDQLAKLVCDNLDLAAALRNRAEALNGASVDCALAHLWVVEAIIDQQPEEAARRMEEHVRKAGSVTAVGPEIVDVPITRARG